MEHDYDIVLKIVTVITVMLNNVFSAYCIFE
jgi:hypothetical protein